MQIPAESTFPGGGDFHWRTTTQTVMEKLLKSDEAVSKQPQITHTSPELQESVIQESVGHEQSKISTEHLKPTVSSVPSIIEESPPSGAPQQSHKQVEGQESASQGQTGSELSRALSTTKQDMLTPDASSQHLLDTSSSTRLDWTLTLTPQERSCITLVSVEPCVNKAVDKLESLLDVLTNKLDGEQELRPTSVFPNTPQPSPTRPVSFMMNSIERDRRDSELSVEGIPMGTTVERLRKHTLERKVGLI